MIKDCYKLILIALIVVFTIAILFPKPFNRGIAFLNSKIKLNFPLIPEKPFKLGLDLEGGSHLVYLADLSKVRKGDQKEAIAGLRDVIERRVNIFGVREPQVAINQVGGSFRLVVDLPGVKDVREAIKEIGKTPYLEFREEANNFSDKDNELSKLEIEKLFKQTRLTGQYLKRAYVDFDPQTYAPYVVLEFNKEGKKLFSEITERNIGKRLAIFIDGILISAPVVKEKISAGRAQITGNFSLKEAKALARNLQAGALPIPIKLISQDVIGPSLGKASLSKSLKAGILGIVTVVLFMIAIYRFSGFLASLSLTIYALILLTLFKLIPVTLTLAGIAGAILSVGMAVDANVLIFERQKEERKKGEANLRALEIGYKRAWPSIRDSNLTTLIVALIMFSFGSSFVKGFALTLSLGILVSIFSAMFITKTFQRLFFLLVLKREKF